MRAVSAHTATRYSARDGERVLNQRAETTKARGYPNSQPGHLNSLFAKWIRSYAGYEAIIDFDAVVTNGAESAFILDELAGDGLHFNEVG